MDDRGYIAQALFDRLRGGEVEFRVLGDTRGYPDTAGAEIDLAVHPDALRSMPRAVARFCHEFDLQLVQLLREAHGWHFVRARLDAVLTRLGILAGRVVQPPEALIAFVGPEPERRSTLMRQVARELAPAFPTGLATVEHGFHEQHDGVDLRVVLEAPEGFIRDHEDVVEVDAAQTLTVQVSRVERQILRWLECRIEQRYPAAVVGDNPLAARLLQFACRHRVPLLRDLIETVLNCGIECRIRSPILMPHPYGIVIDRNAVLGNRVTLMHQVPIGTKHPHDAHSPVIEDNG